MSAQMRTSAAITRDEFHPLRFQKYWPKCAAEVSRLSRTWDTFITPEQFQELNARVQRSYNEAIMAVDFDQRPAGIKNMMQRVEQAARLGMVVRCGMNIYSLSIPLRNALRKTSLGDVRIGDIKAPFESLYIGFEGGSGVKFVTEGSGGVLVVDGAYVTIPPANPGTTVRKIDISLTTRDSLSALRPEYAARWPFADEPHFTFSLEGDFEDSFETALGEALDTNALDLQVDEDAVDNFRQSVVDHQEEAALNGIELTTPMTSSREKRAEFKARNLEDAKKALSLVLGALCAFTARPDDEKGEVLWPEDTPEKLLSGVETAGSAKKKRNAENELKRQGFVSVRRVDLDLFGADTSTVRDGNGSGVAPHWRAGHFRRQAIGKGRALRKLIWILPTIVNAAIGEARSGRIYKVKGEPKQPG